MAQKTITLPVAQEIICSSIIDDSFLSNTADCFREVSGADIAFIALFEPGTPVLAVAAASGDSGLLAQSKIYIFRDGEGKPILCDKPVEGRLSQRKPLAIHPVNFIQEDYSYLAIPIAHTEKIIGVAEVLNKEENALSGKEKQKLIDLARFTAIAFENNNIFNLIYDHATRQEKNRISKDMHDHLCQQLAFLKIQTEMLSGMIHNGEIEKGKDCLSKIQTVINSAYSDVREMIESLRSASSNKKEIDNNPAVFYKTIRDMLKRYHESTGITSELMISEDAGVVFSPEAAEQITLIIQEALMNVFKHAEAKGVLVCFKTNKDNKILLSIEDNGKGFNTSDVYRNTDGHEHYGLKIMQERAESIHAEFEFTSTPGNGTRIMVVLPAAGS